MTELKVEKRTLFGKAAKAIRKQGLAPAELYGHGIENAHVSVNAKEFEKIYKDAGGNTVVNLIVEGKSHSVLIYDVERDPISDELLAVDFYEVRMDEKITAAVPVVFIGESQAVKDGGILIKAMEEIEVEALPADLPEKIEISLAALTVIGSSLYVRDLPQSAKFKYEVGPDTVIASITAQVEEEVVVAPLTPDQVVVETDEKKAERQVKAGEPAEESVKKA